MAQLMGGGFVQAHIQGFGQAREAKLSQGVCKRSFMVILLVKQGMGNYAGRVR